MEPVRGFPYYANMINKTNHRIENIKQSTHMNACIKLCSMALLTIASAATVQASQTNVVQSLTIKMTAWSQGPTTTNGTTVTVKANSQSIATKDILGWLGTATTNNFGSSQLLVMNQLGVPESQSRIIARTITKVSKTLSTTNNVDVSGFFGSVTYAATVNNYSYNSSSNVVNPGTYYGYWGFYLLNNANYPPLPVTFQVSGLGVDSAVDITNTKKAVLGLADNFSITNAAGIGMMGTNEFIIGGNIIISGKTVEVDP
jgi:hypothetical protein